MSRLSRIMERNRKIELKKFNLLTEAVFMNYVILNVIFSHLSTSALKTMRLICQFWESTATPFLAGASVFVPTKMFPCCRSGPIPDINPKLVRCVRLDNHCRSGKCSVNDHKDNLKHLFWYKQPKTGLRVNPSVPRVFHNLAKQYSDDIEEVYLRLMAEYPTTQCYDTSVPRHISFYDFSDLPYLDLVTIEMPSSKPWRLMEMIFDNSLPVPADIQKLYVFPSSIQVEFSSDVTVTPCEKLRILSPNEEELLNPKPSPDELDLEMLRLRRLRRYQLVHVPEKNIMTPNFVPSPSSKKCRNREVKKIVQARPPVRKRRLNNQPRRSRN